MANNFPYIFEENFERGTKGNFDTETDVAGLLSFKHYKDLARYSPDKIGAIAPWRGAYCMEVKAGDANAHHLQADGVDIADTVTGYSSFYLYIGKDLAATVTDAFIIYAVRGTAGAHEGTVWLNVNATTQAVTFQVGQAGAGNAASTEVLERGRWYHVELVSNIQSGGTGTETLFVDGVQFCQKTGITNTAVIDCQLGTQNNAATTTGTIFYDCFKFDSTAVATATRMGPDRERYPETLWLSQSSHVALGMTDLVNVTLLPGTGTNSVLKIYDTDHADTQNDGGIVAQLMNLTASEPPIDLADVPVLVREGAYVQLSGTSPAAIVHIGRSQGYYSAGRVRQHGAKG